MSEMNASGSQSKTCAPCGWLKCRQGTQKDCCDDAEVNQGCPMFVILLTLADIRHRIGLDVLFLISRLCLPRQSRHSETASKHERDYQDGKIPSQILTR